jgi:hypothetical protein
MVLLSDFQKRFETKFNIKPKIAYGRARVYSKEIYERLVNEWDFYSKSWKLPEMPKQKLKLWLRAFFDCEAWIEVEGRKNRRIGLDSINHSGIMHIRNALESMGIISRVKKNKNKNTYRLQIFGKRNIHRFEKEIGFLHPDKNRKLQEAIDSYPNYLWDFPENPTENEEFVRKIMCEKARFRKPSYIAVVSNRTENIKTLSLLLKRLFNVKSRLYESRSGQGTKYHELIINRKKSVAKALKHRLLNKEQLMRMEDSK